MPTSGHHRSVVWDRPELVCLGAYDGHDLRRNGGRCRMAGLAAGKPVVVPDLLTRIGLQTIRVLPWQVIARASQSRNR
jgi:hypothetical protein